MEIITLLIFAVLVVLFMLNLINLAALPVIRKSAGGNDIGEKVSVLIPARNEEQNILACINSVLGQTYPNMEVLVLDDNSTDNTGSILNGIADSRLRVISGAQLPNGWVGKNFACHQLQSEATGEYLLFIDADTALDPECITSAVEFLHKNNPDLLTVLPNEISVSFWEKLVIPMLYFAFTVFIPIPLITGSKKKQIAAGNGQFMMFKRKFYDFVGGHKSLQNKIVEDVWLARRVKEFGGKLIIADAVSLVSCRMYRNFKEVWDGFSKNVFAGLSFSVAGLAFIVLTYLTLFVLPPLLMITGLLEVTIYSVSIVLIPVVMRLIQAFKFRQPIIFSFLNPLSALFVIAVAINSFLLMRFGKGATWKDRSYAESMVADG